jgi:hypothetical protein
MYRHLKLVEFPVVRGALTPGDFLLMWVSWFVSMLGGEN